MQFLKQTNQEKKKTTRERRYDRL